MTDTVRPEALWPSPGSGSPLLDAPATSSAAQGDTGAPVDGHEPEGEVVRSSPVRLLFLVAGLVVLGMLGLPILLMVLAILISVFLHEMGHYLAAKKTGMKVTEFFIGFGPRIWSFQRGETEYGFKAIPAGAYVRIIGMHSLEEVAAEDEARTYRQAAYWKRMVTVGAGPAMNLLIAFTVLIGLFAVAGKPNLDGWSVGAVVAGSGAEAAGFKEGDQIRTIAGEPIETWEQFGATVRERAGETVDVVVLRDGHDVTLTLSIGERLTEAGAAVFGGVLYRDDVIEAVDGEAVDRWSEVVAALDGRAGEDAELTVRRRVTEGTEVVDRTYDIVVVVPKTLPEGAVSGFAGLGAGMAPPVSLSPIEAVTNGTGGFVERVLLVGGGFTQMFTPANLGDYFSRVVTTPPVQDEADDPEVAEGPLPPASVAPPPAMDEDLQRPVSILGIIQIGNSIAEVSWYDFVHLIVIFNLFLGLVNLLPLPPLDGGHLAVATYERLRSRHGKTYRVDMAKLLPVTYAVFMVFVFIGLSSLYLDVVDPVQLP